MILARLDKNCFTDDIHEGPRPATMDDVPGVFDLYQEIEEFRDVSLDIERLYLPLKEKTGRLYVLEENESMDLDHENIDEGSDCSNDNCEKGSKTNIVTSLGTTAESPVSAILVGLMTHPDHRGKGYATACLVRACADLISEGKDVYILYDNPDAGRIYLAMGFCEVGRWCAAIK